MTNTITQRHVLENLIDTAPIKYATPIACKIPHQYESPNISEM